MTNNLHVGNLPFSATAQDLQNLFAQSGVVSAIEMIFDNFTGRSRGCAHVAMATPEDARRVIETYDGRDLGGRPLTITAARTQEEQRERDTSAG